MCSMCFLPIPNFAICEYNFQQGINQFLIIILVYSVSQQRRLHLHRLFIQGQVDIVRSLRQDCP